ncbi:MAG: hypothetical protein AAF532_15405 [Planctomycetota bacterium]
MTAAELKEHLDRDPFVPFEMVMTEGPAIPVRTREKTLLNAKGGLVMVVSDDDLPISYGTRHIVEVREIAGEAATR